MLQAKSVRELLAEARRLTVDCSSCVEKRDLLETLLAHAHARKAVDKAQGKPPQGNPPQGKPPQGKRSVSDGAAGAAAQLDVSPNSAASLGTSQASARALAAAGGAAAAPAISISGVPARSEQGVSPSGISLSGVSLSAVPAEREHRGGEGGGRDPFGASVSAVGGGGSPPTDGWQHSRSVGSVHVAEPPAAAAARPLPPPRRPHSLTAPACELSSSSSSNTPGLLPRPRPNAGRALWRATLRSRRV